MTGFDVDAAGAVAAVAEEWEALADELEAPPFHHPGWFQAFSDAFPVGTVEIVTVRLAGRLVAVAPMHRRRGVLDSLANYHTPSFALLAATPQAAREAAEGLLARRARRVVMRSIVPDGSALDVLRAAGDANGYRLIVRTQERSPYVAIDRSWDAYERSLDKRFRGDVRRRRRRLAEQGDVTFEVTTGAASLERLLEEGFRVEAAGWKGEDGSAIASSQATQRFYTELARWAAPRGWLRLAFLRLDGRAIAFDYCLEAHGVHYLLKTGYDPIFRSFSPGMLIRHHMLARAFERGLRLYDFVGIDEPWKMRWTSTTRERLLFQAFRPSALGLVEHSAFAYGRPFVKRAFRRGTEFVGKFPRP